jgi:trk system potassium uptake protein
MRIIVIGAGEVGSYVTERLSREEHDVALIEQDPARVGELEPLLDALVIRGSGTDPETLLSAGAAGADLVVAVTSDDETNIVSAMVAKHLGANRTIARIERRGLRETIARDLGASCGTDMVIDPDEETSAEIIELVQNPGAVEVEVMAGGEIVVLGVRLMPDAPVVGQTLQQLGAAYTPNWRFLFGAITRGADTIIPRGDYRFHAGDLVCVICTRDARQELAALLGLERATPARVVLLGGGRTAELLAMRLVDQVRQVVVVEWVRERADELAALLRGVQVVHGDITDADMLNEINVGPDDLVVALTGDDDANILACLYAKSAGVTETISLVHRLSLLPLLAEIGVDGALSPRTATANAVLRVARVGVTAVATFQRGDVEVLEIEIPPYSAAVGKTMAELHLPEEALVGAGLSPTAWRSVVDRHECARTIESCGSRSRPSWPYRSASSADSLRSHLTRCPRPAEEST